MTYRQAFGDEKADQYEAKTRQIEELTRKLKELQQAKQDVKCNKERNKEQQSWADWNEEEDDDVDTVMITTPRGSKFKDKRRSLGNGDDYEDMIIDKDEDPGDDGAEGWNEDIQNLEEASKQTPTKKSTPNRATTGRGAARAAYAGRGGGHNQRPKRQSDDEGAEEDEEDDEYNDENNPYNALRNENRPSTNNQDDEELQGDIPMTEAEAEADGFKIVKPKQSHKQQPSTSTHQEH